MPNVNTEISSVTLLGLEESAFLEEMEWIKQVKSQNQTTSVNDIDDQVGEMKEAQKQKTEEKSEMQKILELEKKVTQKIEISRPKTESSKTEEPETISKKETNGWHEEINGVNQSSMGLDESVLQEEIAWVREMKIQNTVGQNEFMKDKKESQTPLVNMSVEDEIAKSKEKSMIEDLASQVAERIAEAKLKEKQKMKEMRKQEEEELALRIHEEMKLAEEMRLAEEEGK